jgi:histidine triad (HIT) family protein
MAQCPFCEIVHRNAPARVVYETGSHIAFFPLEPATLGHTLIIPKRHYENFFELPASDVPDLWLAVREVALAIREALIPDGMNIITSAGRAATQTVLHLHVHAVPRWEGDRFGDIWPPRRPTSEQMLDSIATAIAHSFERG